jgi:MFS family permease
MKQGMKQGMNRGMNQFRAIWLGQLVSVLGSGAGWFAVTVWAWRSTGSATQFALLAFTSFGAGLVASPLAGVLVDRLSRKAVMLLCDSGLAVCSVVVLSLYSTDHLRVWHLMLIAVVEGVLEALHWLAYAALITDLVPEERRSRANGLVALADPASEVLAPALGGALLGATSLGGVLIVDLATYLVAVCTLAAIPVPDHRTARPPTPTRPSLRSDILAGFDYIRRHPGLRTMAALYFVMNLVGGVAYALNSPLVLLRNGDRAEILGMVVAAGGAGGLLGALLMSAWPGPRRRARFVAAGIALGCAFGPLLMAVSHTAPLWLAATFIAALVPAMTNTVNQTLWQSAVPTELQGRVFGARRLVTQASVLIGLLGAGPLADSSSLSGVFDGWLLGTGKEAVAAAVIAAVALLGLATSLAALLSRGLRTLDSAPAPAPTPAVSQR